MPKVSIITALHNKGPYIAETIRSVLGQTLSDWEMIVVENGSTDNGPEIVRQFSDPRIRLVVSPKQGPGAARNFGLGLATGEWILFLDADDLIEPDYLASRLGAPHPAPEVKVIAGPWKEFADQSYENETLRYPASWKHPRALLDAAAFAYAPWVIHAAIVRRDHLLAGPRWNEALDRLPSEDCAFWFPVVHQAGVAWSDHAGAKYRRNISSSRDDQVQCVLAGFAACVGTLEANLAFLKRRGERPTTAQAATVVRVLRRLLDAAAVNTRDISGIRREICRWLRATSFLDLRMVFWRFKFAEFRRGLS